MLPVSTTQINEEERRYRHGVPSPSEISTQARLVSAAANRRFHTTAPTPFPFVRSSHEPLPSALPKRQVTFNTASHFLCNSPAAAHRWPYLEARRCPQPLLGSTPHQTLRDVSRRGPGVRPTPNQRPTTTIRCASSGKCHDAACRKGPVFQNAGRDVNGTGSGQVATPYDARLRQSLDLREIRGGTVLTPGRHFKPSV